MIRILFFVLFWLIFSPVSTLGQASVRVMQYNLLNFGNPCGNLQISARYTTLKTIVEAYQPEIMGVNELAPNVAYATGIKALSFAYDPDIDFADFTNTTNSPIVNQLFFSTAIFNYLGVEVIQSFRDINVYHLQLRPELVQDGNPAPELYVILGHFKAGNSSSDISSRAQSATAIANWRSAHPEAENILVMGDFNLDNSGESAWQTLVNNSNPALRFIDPTGQTSGWGGAPFAGIHTQSTQSSGNSCFSGGGLDDRFDFILISQAIEDGSAGISLVANTYQAYGNDGNSFDVELNCSASSPVPPNVCGALKQLSDHLPVVLSLEFPTAVSLSDPFEAAGLRTWAFADAEGLAVHLDGQPELLAKGWKVRVFDLNGKEIIRAEVPPFEEKWTRSSHLSPGFYVALVEVPGLGKKTLRLHR